MFDRVQFWGADWKARDMQARMFTNKGLNFLPSVNRGIVPDQHNRTGNGPQQMSQEFKHLLTREGPPIHLHLQFDSVRFGCNQQGTDHIGALVMIQTRANRGRLTTRCPGSFDRTHQRFATFVEKNKGRAQALPFFLSAATDSVSNTRWRLHRVAIRPVEAFGSSTSFDGVDTKHYAVDSAPRITFGSRTGYAAPSSNRLNNQKPARHGPGSALNA